MSSKTRLASAQPAKQPQQAETLTYDEIDLFERMVLNATFPGTMSEHVSELKKKLARMKSVLAPPPPETPRIP